jgi:hypothetical protein
MATSVTITGASNSTILLPFASAANAAAAQAAVAVINSFTTAGFEQIDTTTPSASLISLPNTAPYGGGAYVTGDSGTTTFLGAMPASYSLLINASSGFTAAVGGANTEVFSSGTGDFTYYNTSTAGEIFLGGGGGVASILEGYAGAAATIGLDGQAQIDGSTGSTTVNAYAGSFANIIEGAGQVSVVAQTGTSIVYVQGSNPTTTVTVAGSAGSNIVYVPGSGSGFINPGAGSVLIADLGGTGTETLFGGNAVIGGQSISAAAFTGNATVYGGLGFFEGGSEGGNVLLTGTVAGATTLIGGGNGDILIGYGVNDQIYAGAGNETLLGRTGSPTLGGSVNTQVGGEFFATGAASTSSTFLAGDQSGNDTIAMGGGVSTIELGHATSAATGITSTSGNTLLQQAGFTTGSATITGFAAQAYGFGAFDKINLLSGETATFANDGNNNAVATLSNGSTITFQGISETSQYQVTTHSGAGGTTYIA